MQLLATAELMQAYERVALRSLAIPGMVLMENAGRSCVDELARRKGPLAGRAVTVVCGKGNNGGDGFVISRHLAHRGCDVRVSLLAKKSAIRGDARVNLESALAIAKVRGSGLRVREVRSARQLTVGHPDGIIVDAILGTGFTGDVRGLYKDAIEWINRQDAFIVAVDVPSGLDATTGSVSGPAVRAHLTVSMGLAKVGLYVGAGAEHSGEVTIGDIGITPAVIRPPRDPVYRVLGPDVSALLPVRARNAHKYTTGKVLVIGGSRSFTGAPFMTAMAAMKSGAGAVILAVPQSIHAIMARRMTEVIIAPLPETPAGSLGESSLPGLLDRAAWADVIAIGPGLSREPETMALVRKFLSSVAKPMVVDADALIALAGQHRLLQRRNAATIVTPHTGEFAVMTGVNAPDADIRRVAVARTAARKWKSTFVLKGAPTVTADERGASYVNSTGNPGMATIGSGDVLTGLIAGLHAQGMKHTEAAFGGVFLHGLAGDVAAERYGERSMLASDILECIVSAFARLSI